MDIKKPRLVRGFFVYLPEPKTLTMAKQTRKTLDENGNLVDVVQEIPTDVEIKVQPVQKKREPTEYIFQLINKIYLDNEYGYNYVILEYLSSPSDDPNYKVPIQIREAVLSYIAWRDIELLPSGRRVTLGDKQLRRKEFYNQKRLARLRVNPVTPWDANEIIRMGYCKSC